jgi:GH35 family endo-1,4-beta-xylanase
MAFHKYRLWVTLAMAGAVALAAASPCAARGTGGFLREWIVCGPLDGTQLDAPDLPDDFRPYPGLFEAGGIWIPISARADGRVDLDACFPNATSCTALLHTYLSVPTDGTYRLRVGSDDSVRVEIDGRVVHSNPARRAWRVDEDRFSVKLTRGWHRVLVRVINYQAEWKVSVRVADEKDQPLELTQQAGVPEPLEGPCRLDEPLVIGDRMSISLYFTGQISRLQNELGGAIQRISQTPTGYVTFAEYEGARAQGIRFFEAMAAFWLEAGSDEWDLTAMTENRRAAVDAARTFSEVLAQETAAIIGLQTSGPKVWEILGGEAEPRRQTSMAIVQVAERLARTRQLAARIENERVRAARYENDIRNWRQRNLAVRVVDIEGGTVDGAEVEIVQTSHDFLFGCNLFAFRRFETEPRNRLYEKEFRDLFNLATVPLYWSVLEKRPGRPEWEAVDAAIRWCRQQHIRTSAHPVLWSETLPRWLDDLKPDEARQALESHVRQTLERYRDTVNFWDVIRSPALPLKLGPVTIEPTQAMRWAADAKPAGRLMMAGADVALLAEATRRTQAAGVRIDGVDLAAPQEERLWPADQLQAALDAASIPNLPVYVTEVAIPGGPEEEAEQAEAVRHFYTAAFAHPHVAGITWWDLSDRFAAGAAPTGLLRSDLTPKPAYEVLDRLINHLWRTHAAGKTGEDGRVAVRAFFGNYRITVRQGRRSATMDVHLGRDGPGDFQVVLPPAR